MNKQELIKKLKRLRDTYPADDSHEGVRQGLLIAIGMIDQLGELKVLSQEWIDNNAVHVRGLGDIFEAVAVESLLVPKKELPVIPQFVADYIDRSREEGHSLYGAFDKMSTEVANWLIYSKSEGKSEGQDTFARAWLDGYEVEKEKLYYIPLGILRLGDKPIYLQKTLDGLDVDWSPPEHMYRYKANYHFTKQEIKDYDERFWPFAMEVAE